VGGEEGMRGRGAVKNHKSECGDLVPERKGVVEVGLSKTVTEVGVKMATPLGRRKGRCLGESEIRLSRGENRQRRGGLCERETVRR
jgi:hypothetical protein